ncbi:MAG TPA: glycosyltransferase [Chloroflexota bacterium]|nr:glycosyltransferase [Chloroflexota bacterium]
MTRVNLVHDFLYVYGGAERLVEHAHAVWPAAPLHTLLYVRDRLPPSFAQMDVRTTWVDRLPARRRLQRAYAMLQPVAFATVRAKGDVLSFASFGAKAVRARGGRHVCYCFTPPRFLWGPHRGLRRAALPAPVRLTLTPLEAALRRWDYAVAQRVDAFIVMTEYVAERLRRVYGRGCEIVAPPVDVARFLDLPLRDDGYFLAIEACRRLGVPLKVVGGGIDEPALRRLSQGAPHVELLGEVSDAAVGELLAGCRALLFPGEEDFGLTAVEAQAAGKPVIAYATGGARETVVDGETGVFFPELSVDALATAIERFDPSRYRPEACRQSARRFAPERFRARLRETVERLWESGRIA